MPINLIISILFFAFASQPITSIEQKSSIQSSGKPIVTLVVLGTIQDAGSPHIGCKKDCCKDLFEHPDIDRQVVSLGLIDHEYNTTYLFEATPDFVLQTKKLSSFETEKQNTLPNGIFLTHAHIGHYTGLMYLGKEAINAAQIPVYAMPQMQTFLTSNGPWSQLVSNSNIILNGLTSDSTVVLTPNISVKSVQVPHRDEYSETVGYIIYGPSKRVLFIPDIDKWEKWDKDIISILSDVDIAFIDGTFYDAAEINYRNIKDIPHPFIIESMEKFDLLPDSQKDKIHFIHFNHTNPVINPKSKQYREVRAKKFHIAKMNQIIVL